MTQRLPSAELGFTLLEVLASIALFSLLAVALWPWLGASARASRAFDQTPAVDIGPHVLFGPDVTVADAVAALARTLPEVAVTHAEVARIDGWMWVRFEGAGSSCVRPFRVEEEER